MVLKRPLISEKSMDLVKLNMYTFEVDKGASKAQIKKEVSEKFKVDILSVKTWNLRGKTKIQRTKKGYFTTAPSKKALVVVAKGQKIALFEQTPENKATVETAENTDQAVPAGRQVKEKKNLLKGTKVKIEKEPKSAKTKGAKRKGDK